MRSRQQLNRFESCLKIIESESQRSSKQPEVDFGRRRDGDVEVDDGSSGARATLSQKSLAQTLGEIAPLSLSLFLTHLRLSQPFSTLLSRWGTCLSLSLSLFLTSSDFLFLLLSQFLSSSSFLIHLLLYLSNPEGMFKKPNYSLSLSAFILNFSLSSVFLIVSKSFSSSLCLQFSHTSSLVLIELTTYDDNHSFLPF